MYFNISGSTTSSSCSLPPLCSVSAKVAATLSLSPAVKATQTEGTGVVVVVGRVSAVVERAAVERAEGSGFTTGGVEIGGVET